MENEETVEAAICAECGAEIPDTALGAVCPSCLMGGLWEDVPVQSGGLFSVEGHEVQRELGRGGMGIVYLANQTDPPREVALKMLLPAQGISPGMRERFRMEAATVAALDHPHILPVYATGERDGLPWFTLKLASGGTLAERAAEYRGRWREIAELLATLSEAVHFAHQRGVLHRDLKPGNVIFDEQGTPYVSDFGLAKWIAGTRKTQHSVTMDGSTMGTPRYLPPEAAKQGAAAATAASDTYGLGAMLYELLAGQPPFAAESTPELMRRIYEDHAVPPARVNPDSAAGFIRRGHEVSGKRTGAALWISAGAGGGLAVVARGPRRAGTSGEPCGMGLALGAAKSGARRHGGGTAPGAHCGRGAADASQGQLRAALAESLLNQARMTAMGSDQGTRNAALRLLRQADINGADASPELAAQRRTEIARVLALPELTQTAAWLASSSSSEGGESFSTDLTRYLAATPDGGFALYNTSDRAVLKSWPSLGDGGPPALRLHLSPDEKLAAVICAGDSNAPALVVVVSVVNGRRLHEWPCDPVSREWPLWLPDGGFLFANSRMSCVRSDAGGNVRPFPDAARATDMVPLALSPDGTRAVRTPAAP